MKNSELERIWNKVPVDYYEKGMAGNFGQRCWHNQKFSVIQRLTIGISPREILDIGSNGGNLTAKIAKLFPKAKVTGVDVYDKAISYASSQYSNIKFLVVDGQKLPFVDNKFDLIFCLETLEHVTDPSKTLEEIKRSLSKNGRALISMDSGSLPFRVIWFFWTKFGKGKVWRGSHLTHFNRKLLKEMVLEKGFVIESETVSHFGMAITFKVKKK